MPNISPHEILPILSLANDEVYAPKDSSCLPVGEQDVNDEIDWTGASWAILHHVGYGTSAIPARLYQSASVNSVLPATEPRKPIYAELSTTTGCQSTASMPDDL